jgi:glycosyltransferase involved in cell wall biosynthesis
MDVRVATVIPCYNEATRLPAEDFLRFQRATPNVDFVFVNDGSTDGTLAVLDRMVACAPTRFAVVNLKTNQGKSEAVRTGIQVGLKRGCQLHRILGRGPGDSPRGDLPVCNHLGGST